ncbi:hypothetical protein [Priestia sp. SB1]|uniref:hypothetical protein n=1 Tax=Priestia sp. SB1 TaxID=3132359 RepID=UPI00319D8CF6
MKTETLLQIKWDKSSLVEGRFRTRLILDRESKAFGFFYCDGKRRFHLYIGSLLFKKANKIGDFKPNDKKICVVCQKVVEIDSFFGMCKKNCDKKTDRMLQIKLASFLHKK